MYVLNVDLWSEDALKEVNLVRHTTATPSISSTSPASYAQIEQTTPAYSHILPSSNRDMGYSQQMGYPSPGQAVSPYGMQQPYGQGRLLVALLGGGTVLNPGLLIIAHASRLCFAQRSWIPASDPVLSPGRPAGYVAARRFALRRTSQSVRAPVWRHASAHVYQRQPTVGHVYSEPHWELGGQRFPPARYHR